MQLNLRSLAVAMMMGGVGMTSGCTRAVDGAPGAQGIQGETGPSGAQGVQGPLGPTGPRGDAGVVSLVRTTLELPGTNCTTGGVLVEVGVDANGDGVLSNAEVSAANSRYVCNGAVGAQGAVGPVGPMGLRGDAGIVSLTKSTPVVAGTDCAAGGTKLEMGLDLDGDGALAASEVNAAFTRFVCNGVTGATGATGAQGPIGPQGLQGVQGLSTLARTTAEPAGANCAAGGTKLEFGIDADSNGTLSAAEVNAALTRYLCDGVTGAMGPQGPVGATGATGAVGPQGAVGATGATGAVGPQGPVGATGAVGPQGAVGATGATGAVGPQGAVGATGATGAVGPQGSAGVAGPAGATGPQGPAGTGGGLKLYDGNNATLGSVTSVDMYGISIVTSTGYLVYINWDGTMGAGQIWYSGAGCTGTALLNSGGPGAGPIYGKTVVYSGSRASLMAPTTVGANGLESASSIMAATIDNPTCMASPGTSDGWQVSAIAPATVGLPRLPPFTTPLSMH